MSRVWDIHPRHISTQRLRGEHAEIHGCFTVIHEGKKGYSKHPETLRWYGKLPALRKRHDEVVAELERRGSFCHKSPLPITEGSHFQDRLVDTLEDQIEILKSKGAWVD